MKAILAGIILGAATLAFASHLPPTKPSVIPIPLCPPDSGGCDLNR